jgi:hypothetical protein
MRIRSIVAASAAILMVSAVPAHAYNADAYSYAAGHMISVKQIPSLLGMKSGGYFNASPNSGRNWLCGDNDQRVDYPAAKYSFNISYNAKKNPKSSISVNVNQYASSQKAEAAWQEFSKKLSSCAGQKTGTETYDDGSTDAWARNTTVGNVPLVTVAGVVSKFMDMNYTDALSDPDEHSWGSDNYSVYSLVNDVIIVTNHYNGNELNLTAAQRKAVNMTAFNAVGAWVD